MQFEKSINASKERIFILENCTFAQGQPNDKSLTLLSNNGAFWPIFQEIKILAQDLMDLVSD